jgi:DNA-binding NtrC family response regulator
LVIPPLRDRREQIGPLALSFLKEAQAKRDKRAPLQVAADLLPRLEAYDWPGNVRELKAVLERALLLARGEIQARHLALAPLPRSRPDSATDLSDRDNAQRQRIVDALAECNGNQTRAAKKLGMSRSTLVTKLALYKIPRPRV